MTWSSSNRCRTGLAAVTAVVALSGCSLVADDPDPVTWDLRAPVTAQDLGARSSTVVDVEGGTPLTVVFPSGRAAEGEWGRGAFADADADGQPISRVVIEPSPVENAEELLAELERFEEEWGPVETSPESPRDLIASFDEFLATAGDDPNLDDFLDVPNNVRSFSAALQDGIEPVWIFRFRGENITIRWNLSFEPAEA